MRARLSGTPARAGSLRQPGAAASATRPQFPRPHSGLEDPVPPVPELPSRAPRCTHLACSTVQGCGPQPAGLGTSGNVWRHLDRPCCGGGVLSYREWRAGPLGNLPQSTGPPHSPTHFPAPNACGVEVGRPCRVAWHVRDPHHGRPWGAPCQRRTEAQGHTCPSRICTLAQVTESLGSALCPGVRCTFHPCVCTEQPLGRLGGLELHPLNRSRVQTKD